MKKFFMLGFILCLSLQAEVKIDKDKWGVIQHVMYKGYVMDSTHAISIMNKLIGRRPWVGSGNTLRAGGLFMTVKSNLIVVTSSYKLVRAADSKNIASRRRTAPVRIRVVKCAPRVNTRRRSS